MQWWMPQPKLSGGLLGAAEVELVRVFETVWTPIGRTLEHDDAITSGQRLIRQLGGLERRPAD